MRPPTAAHGSGGRDGEEEQQLGPGLRHWGAAIDAAVSVPPFTVPLVLQQGVAVDTAGGPPGGAPEGHRRPTGRGPLARTQYIVVSHRPQVYEQAQCIVGLYCNQESSLVVTAHFPCTHQPQLG